MNWLLTIADKNYRLSRADVLIKLNRAAQLRCRIGNDIPSLFPGQSAELRITESGQETPVHTLPVCIDSLGIEGEIIACPREDAASSRGSESPLRIIQKQTSETLIGFLNRCGLSGNMAETTGEDGDIKVFEQELPPGCCILAQPGDGPDDMAEKVFGLLQRRTSSIVGRSRSLHTKDFRICTFNPHTNDPNWFFDAKPEHWKLAPQTRGQRSIIQRLYSDDLKKILETLQGTEKILEIQSSGSETPVTLPMLPTTVRVGERFYFCPEILYRFYMDKTEPETNLDVELRLTETVRRYSPNTGKGQPEFLLGLFEGWLKKDGAQRLVSISPAPLEKIKEQELKPLTQWIADDGESGKGQIAAALVVPGFVRDGHSGFYARLKPGDLILVSLINGGFPQVMGSLQMQRPEFEQDSAAEVAFSATGINLSAVKDDGASADTGLLLSNQGKLDIKAKDAVSVTAENLSMLDTVKMKKNETGIQGKVEIKGNLEVG